MDGEGSNPTEEHVFVVSIAANNEEESLEVLYICALHDLSANNFAP